MTMEQTKQRMDSTIEALRKEFGGLRTGRASTNLLDNIQVEAYGNFMPLNQVGTVGVPEPRLLTVQVWDKGMVKSVEKAIRDANLGLNPQADGQLVRVPVPALSMERRQELAKVAGKFAEAARIAARNVRRDALDELKKAKLPEDEMKGQSDKVQKLTDETIKKIDEALAAKEKEITSV